MLTAEDLNAMTIAQIKAEADANGYTISGKLKAELIESYLEAQNG